MAQPSLDISQGVLQIADRETYSHPDQWDRSLYRIKPLANRYPLTAMMAAIGSTKTTSRRFHWAVQPWNNQSGAVTDVYTDTALSSAYSSGATTSTTLYVKMTAANAAQFRSDDLVIFTETTTYKRIVCRVVAAPTLNGASSYITIVPREADTDTVLAAATIYFNIGPRSEAEVSELPEVINEEHTWYDAYSQQMLEAWAVSDREAIEFDRLDPNVKTRKKMEALDRLTRKREVGRFFGVGGTGSDGRTYSTGLYNFLKDNAASTNIINWKTDSTYNTDTSASWLNGWWDFFNNAAEYRGRYSGSTEIDCFTSGIVLNAIDAGVVDRTHYPTPVESNKYGIRIKKLQLGRETWNLIEHPMFSIDPALQRSMAVVEVPLLETRTLQAFKEVRPGDRFNDGWNFVTAEKGGWLVDEGLAMKNFDAHLWIDNLGVDR